MTKNKRKNGNVEEETNKNRKVTVEGLLGEHPTLKVVQTEFGEKIKSTLTGHEFKNRLDLLENFIKSKAYVRALEGWYKDEQFEKYAPYIVPHKRDKKKLFCTLFRIPLNKIPSELENHVNGKKFKRLKKEAEEARAEKEAKEARKREKQELYKKKQEEKKGNKSFDISNLENNLAGAIDSDGED